MDLNESNVRLLLDLNRYRPPRVPTRKLQIPLQLQHPMKVSVSYTREIDARTSLVAINIRNNHHNRSLRVHDVVMHLERTVVNAGPSQTSTSGAGKPQRKPLRQTSNGSEKSHRSASFAGDSDDEGPMDDPQVAGRLMKSGASAQRARQTLRSATIPSDFHTHLHCHLLRPTSTSQLQSVGVGSSFVISPEESFSLVYSLTHSRTQSVVSGRFLTPVTLTWSLTPSVNKNTATSDSEPREEDALSALCAKLLLQPDPSSEVTTNKVVFEEVPFEHPLEWTLGIKATTGESEQ